MGRNESGSAHIIIVSILAIALVASIGFIFWQNVINKPANTANNPIKVAKTTDSPKPQSKTYCTALEKICFDYPADWKVSPETVDADMDGVAEKIIVADQAGKPWLRLQTGMGGLGGMCANDDNSYTKILKTHTTAVHGDYLVNEVAKDYVSDTAYAVAWATYDGTNKNWTIDMDLNNSKKVQNVGRLDPCDIGLGVINGKNAKAAGSSTAGGMEFKYFTGVDTSQTYATEAEATAALTASSAAKAYEILQSARYE